MTTTPPPVSALNDDEFTIAAAEAGYVCNDDPCDIPGKPMGVVEDRICEYIDAREGLRAAEAIAQAFDASPAWSRTPSQAAVDYRRRIAATLRNRRAAYEVKLANISGEGIMSPSDQGREDDLARLIGKLAESTGRPVDEILKMRRADLVSLMAEIEARRRASLREAIVLERIAETIEAAGMPAQMGIRDGIEAGYTTVAHLEAATMVTGVELDAAITAWDAGREL